MIHASPPENEYAADIYADETPQRLVPVRRRLDAGHRPALGAEVEPTDTSEQHADDCACMPLLGADEVAPSQVVDLLTELPTPELRAAAAGETLEAEREHLQLQVAQLAAHLHERLREMDRREGQLNARAAQFEADQRAAGLWLRERETEFQQREHELSQSIAELQERLSVAVASQRELATAVRPQAEIEEREQNLSQREQRLAEYEQELTRRDQEFDLREQELLARRERLEQDAAALLEAEQALKAKAANQEQAQADERERLAIAAARITERETELATFEERLNRRAAQIGFEEAEWEASRQAAAHRTAQRERAFHERQQALEAEMDDRRRRLEARQNWIEQQKTSIERTRAQILQLHRQSLEMRLMAEQLWSQIAGSLSPAETTHRIAQLKKNLSDQYGLEEEALEARKVELVALSERIAAQYEELSQLRRGMREWAAARQAEIEQQAAALVERELALDEQQAESRRQRQQWRAEHRLSAWAPGESEPNAAQCCPAS